MHLNITLEEQLYAQLKARTPAKKMSAFIAEAIAAKLGPSADELNAAYRAASKEAWRRQLDAEWAATDGDAWPE